MAFHSAPDRPPARPSRFRLLLFLLLVYGCVKVFGGQHLQRFRLPPPLTDLPPPIVQMPEISGASPAATALHLGGRRVWGNGASIDLGDRRTHLPASLISKFFPDEFVLASCLTEVPPGGQSAPPPKLLPVRDDWPGFYGAPWIARLDGNLLVLLNVYAPRDAGLPVPAPQFELYPAYTGAALTPALSVTAPAKLYRGSKAVLYRVFLDAGAQIGPLRCLDLIVQNGENNGIGRLYYQRYHHYYEADANFVVQQ
jgi:hypothetical protein